MDSRNILSQATSCACANKHDKIFLLSEKEVTTSSYGFVSYSSSEIGNARIRVTTDFVKANYALQNTSSGYGGWWWLRSPLYSDRSNVLVIPSDGDASDYYWYDYALVNDMTGGVVPALSISLQ